MPHLEITEVILVHRNVVNNYQQNSRASYIFAPNKSFSKFHQQIFISKSI